MIDASMFDVELNSAQQTMFDSYASLLLEYNGRVNLTRITERDEIDELHFLDSLAGARILFPEGEGRQVSVIDIGSGAGFPGVPLKIAYPQIDLTLIDSVNKKLEFLRALGRELSFDGSSFHVLHGRAEDLGREKGLRENFDYALLRAVAPMPVLLEYALPFLKPGGELVAYKGPGALDEIRDSGRALKILGGEISQTSSFSLPSGAQRTLVSAVKKKKTPSLYPRRAGTPKKDPL